MILGVGDPSLGMERWVMHGSLFLPLPPVHPLPSGHIMSPGATSTSPTHTERLGPNCAGALG